VIRQDGNKYTVLSDDGKRKFGTYATRAEAESRLRQIESFGKMQPTSAQVHVDSTQRKPRKPKVYVELARDNFTPPAGVARTARRAQNWIADGKAGSGFTDVGRARAAQLANRQPVSEETIGRMNSFFARHAVDREASGFRLGEKGFPSPGRVAWDAWGGDAGRSWARNVKRQIDRKVKKQACPVATQDVKVNLENRKDAIDTAQYGPLDPNLPNDLYWQERAEEFNTTPDEAKKSRCGNCAAFDVTSEIKDCIASGIGKEERPYRYDGQEPRGHAIPSYKQQDPFDVIDAGELGYCRVFKFKCAAARTCSAWIGGGPITDENDMPDEETGDAPEDTYEVDSGNVKVEININQGGTPKEKIYAPYDDDRPLLPYESYLTMRKQDERKFTLGPLYIPNKVDAHGEYTDGDELQRAVWDYVRKGDRRIRLQHNRDVVAGEWVEVMTWPYEMTIETTMGDGKVSKTEYPAETVFMGVVWKDWAWDLVKAGKVRGYSIGGQAQRLSVEMDEDVTKMAKATKTEDGVDYPAEAFAYVPDPDRVSTWKLRLWENLEDKVTRVQLGRAVAALGPTGFRGQRVQIPAGDLPRVKRAIATAWRGVYGDERPLPQAIK
jgi:hypothetical protein